MAINQLIAQGGRGQPSPVERFLDTKAKMEASRANQQTMAMNQEKMGMLQQQEQRKQQEHGIKIMAPLAKGVLTSDDPAAAYQQSVVTLKENNLWNPKMPTEYTDELRPGLEQIMTAGGLALDETYETKQTPTGRYYQESSTKGPDKASPRNEAAKGQTFNIGQKEDSKFTYKELGKAVDDARFANQEKQNIGYIKQAMQGIETGSLTDVKMSVNRLAASLNLPVSNDMANLESANTAMGNLVMAGLNNFPGQISNEERKFVATIMPKLTQTSKGREQIIEFLGRLSDRRTEYREQMTKFVSKHGTLITPNDSFYSKWDRYQKDNPILKNLDLLNKETKVDAEYVEIRTLQDGRKIGLKEDGSKEIIE